MCVIQFNFLLTHRFKKKKKFFFADLYYFYLNLNLNQETLYYISMTSIKKKKNKD